MPQAEARETLRRSIACCEIDGWPSPRIHCSLTGHSVGAFGSGALIALEPSEDIQQLSTQGRWISLRRPAFTGRIEEIQHWAGAARKVTLLDVF
jgi:hypothetical protein